MLIQLILLSIFSFCLISTDKVYTLSIENESRNGHTNVTNITAKFLVSVGEPWNNCNATVSTPFLKPGGNYSSSPTVYVGKCDHGPLTYTVTQAAGLPNDLKVTVTFYTTALAIQAPSCMFSWTGGYVNPSPKLMDSSPLPGCYLQDSQEGYHPTNYMFQLLTWEWF